MLVRRSFRLSGLALAATAGAGLLHPAGTQAQAATEPKREAEQRTYLAVDYSYVSFQGDIDPWRYASISLGQRNARGSLIARVNYARRFSTSGVQFEADAYPRLTRGTYAYLNAGYSDAIIFPTWRFGAELFSNLPGAWEASVGFRQLRFSGPPVTLYTGSLGKYVGNYWFSLRPFVRSKESGTSASATLKARRYFADTDHYVGAHAGYGSTPSDRLAPEDLARMNSFSAGLHGSGGPWKDIVGTWSLGYDREELEQGRIRKSWPVAAGLRFMF